MLCGMIQKHVSVACLVPMFSVLCVSGLPVLEVYEDRLGYLFSNGTVTTGIYTVYQHVVLAICAAWSTGNSQYWSHLLRFRKVLCWE